MIRIYLDLLIGFLRVGLFAFGGAYAAIPLIHDVVTDYGWISEETFINFVAVSESTPGPIMVNLATYIGKTQGGFLGAVIATVGTVLPAYIITVIVSRLMKAYIDNRAVRGVLQGVRPSIIGIIIATGIYMFARELYVVNAGAFLLQWPEIGIAAVLTAILFGYKKLRGKPISPILMIGISAVLGIVVFHFV